MTGVFAALLAGLGLFFVGLTFLTEHLKAISGRRLRQGIYRWTQHPIMGLFWGGALIAVTQSNAATMFLLVSMIRSGMMSMRQAQPIIIGKSMASGLIVLILAIDIKIAIFFLVGISGLLFTSNKVRGIRNIVGAFFGLSLLYLGLYTMKGGVAPLAQSEWFDGLLQWTAGSYALGFLIGAFLCVIVQSAIAIVVIAAAFLRAGLFSIDQAIMIVYGANVGLSFLTYVLSTGLSGQAKQLAMHQITYKILGALILVPLFYAETYGNIFLVKGFTEWVTTNPGGQLGTVYLIFNAVPGFIMFAGLNLSANLLERFWRETEQEQASKPVYLHEHATEDSDSALELIGLEQIRLIDLLSKVFDTQRGEGEAAQLASYREAFASLSKIIREAISDLTTRHQLTPDAYDRLDHLLAIQHALEASNEAVKGLCEGIAKIRQSGSGARFADASIEGLDTIVLTLIDFARDRQDEDGRFLSVMTSEDGNRIKSVRAAYLAEESGLNPTQRMELLATANHCERLIWLFGEMGRHYMALVPD